MYTLYDFQLKAVNEIRASFANGDLRVVLQSATGSGKTIMFSDIAAKVFKKGKKVAIITDRVELCKQTFSAVSGFAKGFEVMTAGAKISTNPDGIIAMVETLNNKIKAGWDWNPDLIIIDESHKGNFTKILDHWPWVRTIGATATPIGKHFYKYYQNMVHTLPIPQLIEDGRLAPCRAYQMQDDISDLKKSHGEYTDETLFNHFNKPKRYAGVIEKWKEKANGLKTIVFCVNVKHAEETAIAFNEAGIMADCVTGKTKKADRVRILNAHKGGFFPVLVNCGVLTTGYDDQSLMCVVVDRATLSLTLWLQMTGRGGRALEGKKEFIILDFGLNHDRFGRWDSAREWKLEPPKKKSKLEQAAPVKICPQCEAMLFASARKCEYCGYVYPEGSKEPAEGIMVEVPKHVPDELKGRYVSSLRLVELYKLQKAGRFKASFCWRVVRSRVLIYKKAIGLDKHNLFLRIKETKPIITGGSLLKTGERVVYTYAKLAGYSRGWAYRQSKDVENFGFKDYKLK